MELLCSFWSQILYNAIWQQVSYDTISAIIGLYAGFVGLFFVDKQLHLHLKKLMKIYLGKSKFGHLSISLPKTVSFLNEVVLWISLYYCNDVKIRFFRGIIISSGSSSSGGRTTTQDSKIEFT